jgi:hypothetical protein
LCPPAFMRRRPKLYSDSRRRRLPAAPLASLVNIVGIPLIRQP